MENDQNWIKTLVQQESQMENSGQVYMHPNAVDPEDLTEHTLEFLKQLRLAFTHSVSFFNQLKGYAGSIRIYGITGTDGDFMLFRNGYKLIFSMKDPGLIRIYFASAQNNLPGQDISTHKTADYLKGSWGAFGELKWTHNNNPIRIDFMTRHYMTYFVKHSIR